MVINIILALSIPLTLGVGGFFILKAFELGKDQKIEPVQEKFEPVQVDEEKAREFQEFLNEYSGL